MPDTAQERTEAPTPRRREEARNAGQVGKSSDLSAAVVLLGALLTLYFLGNHVLGHLLIITKRCLGTHLEDAIDASQMGLTLVGIMRESAEIILPIMLIAMVLALVSSFAQVGVLLTVKPITPSWDKLSPLSGLKRMFGAKAFFNLAQGVAKTICVTVVAYWTLESRVDMLAQLPSLNHMAVIGVSAEVVFVLGIRLAIVLLILAIIDFVYQKWKTIRDLRMTKEEIKEELKRMDGDPKLKQRRRDVQMQLAMQRIQSAVPNADVVVTNPTELAVALQYDRDSMSAPKVTAKGADYMAKRIREIAIAHGIPIVERKPLARSLYKTVEIGQEIPAELYKAVAEVLAYVYELAGRNKWRQSAPEPALN
jgi:flagellar biosynthetic protein FlhB